MAFPPGNSNEKRDFQIEVTGSRPVLRYHANLFTLKGATRYPCTNPQVKHMATVHDTSMKCDDTSFTLTQTKTMREVEKVTKSPHTCLLFQIVTPAPDIFKTLAMRIPLSIRQDSSRTST